MISSIWLDDSLLRFISICLWFFWFCWTWNSFSWKYQSIQSIWYLLLIIIDRYYRLMNCYHLFSPVCFIFFSFIEVSSDRSEVLSYSIDVMQTPITMFQLKRNINSTVIDISQIHVTTSSLQIQLTSFMITKNHECED